MMIGHSKRVVVVHSGARDAYQVARALEETGRLERLVTDLFWPAGEWRRRLASALPAGLRTQLEARSEKHVPGRAVTLCAAAGLLTLASEKSKCVPRAWHRRLSRWTDAKLGERAGRVASEAGAALLSYSYYGHSAFSHYRGAQPRMLFQLHPHPLSMRRILRAELERHPDCASSLEQEWELALPEEDFERLVEETKLAGSWLAASTFTKNTLVENGIDDGRIRVAPYGVDLERFHPSVEQRAAAGPLRLLFVGRINQRKGVKYLLEALRLNGSRQIQVTVCGRAVDDLKLFEPFRDRVEIRPSVSHAELVRAYQAADLFVFPSVAEGFGHVLLESLACGLPVLSTTATAAPDLLTEGVNGFVVEPGSAEAIAQRLEWALSNRNELRSMKQMARRRAEEFTWEAFRGRVTDFVSAVCDEPEAEHASARHAAAEHAAAEHAAAELETVS